MQRLSNSVQNVRSERLLAGQEFVENQGLNPDLIGELVDRLSAGMDEPPERTAQSSFFRGVTSLAILHGKIGQFVRDLAALVRKSLLLVIGQCSYDSLHRSLPSWLGHFERGHRKDGLRVDQVIDDDKVPSIDCETPFAWWVHSRFCAGDYWLKWGGLQLA